MWFIFFILCGLASIDAEYVTRKYCKGVDPEQCPVHSVSVDPCSQGPAYCNLKPGKKYSLTLNLTPKFSAEKLMLSINGDEKNDGSFSRVLQGPKAACGYLTCPVRPDVTRLFDVDLSLDKTISGKFPVQMKIWNAENESQACCFTFNVKI